MQLVISFIATGMLTDSATHLVRIFQQQHKPPTFWGDITDLATGGSDGFYDVGDWECEFVDDLGSWLLDYMANCNEADILTPVYDPHGLLEGTKIRTGQTPVTADPPHLHQPIPRNGTEPLKVGDRVQIVPEWQDPSDANFERFVIEAPGDSTQVRIQAVVTGLHPQPTEWIEAGRLVFLPAIPPLKHFTVFCQEAGGNGTIHIDHIEAADLESAIIAGKQQCIDDWSAGQTEGESLWNMETVHCLGVAAGDVEILHWEDQPE